MDTLVAESPVASARSYVQVDADSKQKPRIVDSLNDWQYLERSIHRLLAAWGREIGTWDDKSALHRHIWDQAECVRRLRERIAQFPGGKPDAPVSIQLEKLVNTVLLAPSLDDALDGIYELLLKTLVGVYGDYCTHAHPVHDAPTVRLLHEVNQIKSQQWLWHRDYRRRFPHTTDPAYRRRLESGLAACGYFRAPLPVAAGEAARPAGVGTDFRLRKFSARVQPIVPKYEYMSYVCADFATSLEARRLFWAVGYMREKNLPDDQLRWLYDGHYMPWDWHYDISRHLWDESRHGDSGYSRLRDFGISLDEIGFGAYDQADRDAGLARIARERGLPLDEAYRRHNDLLAPLKAEPMSPQKLYEDVFMIGLVAETGHFTVKHEAYHDFRDGKDFESAEMMLFDIIDETAHVQYAHKWLPLLAEHAGVDNTGYRERGAKIREEKQAGADTIAADFAHKLSRTPGDPAFDFYQDLLARIRRVRELTNAGTCPPRSPKPM